MTLVNNESTMNYMSSNAYNLFTEICQADSSIAGKVGDKNFFVKCSSTGALGKKWIEFCNMINTINKVVGIVIDLTNDYCGAKPNSTFTSLTNRVKGIAVAVSNCFKPTDNPFSTDANITPQSVAEFGNKINDAVNAYVTRQNQNGQNVYSINMDKALDIAIYAGLYRRCLGILKSYNSNAKNRIKQASGELSTETTEDPVEGKSPNKINYTGEDYDSERDIKYYGETKSKKVGAWIENKWNANLPIAMIDKFVFVFKEGEAIGKSLASSLGYYGDLLYYFGKKCRSSPSSFLYNFKAVRLISNTKKLKRYSLKIELDAEHDANTGEITKRNGLKVTATGLSANYNYKFDESKSSKSSTLFTTYYYLSEEKIWYSTQHFAALALAKSSISQ